MQGVFKYFEGGSHGLFVSTIRYHNDIVYLLKNEEH
jgi:hypothetical protein